jgi:hypothetical protein
MLVQRNGRIIGNCILTEEEADAILRKSERISDLQRRGIGHLSNDQHWGEVIHKHQFVDLHLPSGTLWASTNIGAPTPYDDGDYFEWGQTEPRGEVEDGEDKGVISPREPSKYNIADQKRVLEPEDDAAVQCWGPYCQMPSSEDFQELLDVCEWKWVEEKNSYGETVCGYRVQGFTTFNSIFLPAAGFIRDLHPLLMHNRQGYYLANELAPRGTGIVSMNNVCGLAINEEKVYTNERNVRGWGYTIRPVRKPRGGSQTEEYPARPLTVEEARAEEGNEQRPQAKFRSHLFVDLALPSGLLWAKKNVGADSSKDLGDRFAWGETATKDLFSWDNYRWGTEDHLTKYTADDGLTTLEPEDDAATTVWGTPCRTPNAEDFWELILNCEKEAVTIDVDTPYGPSKQVTGFKFRSKKNGNELYLPCIPDVGGFEAYWLNLTPNGWPDGVENNFLSARTDHTNSAHILGIDNTTLCISPVAERFKGLYIRPVVDMEALEEWKKEKKK